MAARRPPVTAARPKPAPDAPKPPEPKPPLGRGTIDDLGALFAPQPPQWRPARRP